MKIVVGVISAGALSPDNERYPVQRLSPELRLFLVRRRFGFDRFLGVGLGFVCGAGVNRRFPHPQDSDSDFPHRRLTYAKATKNERVELKELKDRMDIEEYLEKWCQMYVLYLTGTVICPTAYQQASMKYVGLLSSDSLGELIDYNWCGHVLKHMRDGLVEAQTKKSLNVDLHLIMKEWEAIEAKTISCTPLGKEIEFPAFRPGTKVDLAGLNDDDIDRLKELILGIRASCDAQLSSLNEFVRAKQVPTADTRHTSFPEVGGIDMNMSDSAVNETGTVVQDPVTPSVAQSVVAKRQKGIYVRRATTKSYKSGGVHTASKDQEEAVTPLVVELTPHQFRPAANTITISLYFSSSSSFYLDKSRQRESSFDDGDLNLPQQRQGCEFIHTTKPYFLIRNFTTLSSLVLSLFPGLIITKRIESKLGYGAMRCFFPILYGEHYRMIIVDIKQKRFQLFDSKSTADFESRWKATGARVVLYIKEYYAKFKSQVDFKKFKWETIKGITQRSGTESCGDYILRMMVRWMGKVETWMHKKWRDDKEVDQLREQITLDVFSTSWNTQFKAVMEAGMIHYTVGASQLPLPS
ncbi:hypothetical protein LINPERHAP2_LOCUS3569 [Linum perenne]